MQIFKKLEINSIYLPIALHLRLATMTCAHSLSHIITVGAPDDNGRGPGFIEPAKPAIAKPLLLSNEL